MTPNVKWPKDMMSPLEIVSMFALITTFLCGLSYFTRVLDNHVEKVSGKKQSTNVVKIRKVK